MAAKYPKEAESPKTRNVSIQELEKALEQITQEVAEEKQKLKTTFQHLHQMLVEREEKLMAELDAITADILGKVEKRRKSLEKLTQQKEETEKKLQTNVRCNFHKRQLSDIQNQIEKILSEQILFTRVSLSYHIKNIQKAIEDNCHIIKAPNPYFFRTLPLWNEGKGSDLLRHYSNASCIDKNNQLIYIRVTYPSKIEVFNMEGDHQSTLLNEYFHYIESMQTHGDNIYVTLLGGLYKLLRRNRVVFFHIAISKNRLLFIEDMELYTCSLNSLILTVYDLKLKNSRNIALQPISNYNSTVSDIIVKKQQIFVLFKSNMHPNPIQIFQLNGTLIRSLVTGSSIKYAEYFCVDSYENILVSDYEGDCIRIFSPEGILIQSIGRDGVLESPRGISIDLRGRIIILNKNTNLQAF